MKAIQEGPVASDPLLCGCFLRGVAGAGSARRSRFQVLPRVNFSLEIQAQSYH